MKLHLHKPGIILDKGHSWNFLTCEPHLQSLLSIEIWEENAQLDNQAGGTPLCSAVQCSAVQCSEVSLKKVTTKDSIVSCFSTRCSIQHTIQYNTNFIDTP